MRRNIRKRFFCLLLSCIMVLSLGACAPKQELQTQQIFAMDTIMDFAVYGGDTEGFFAAAAQEINRLENLLSRTRDNSDIARINDGETVNVSPETKELLDAALQYSRITDGAFDMTIAPLVTAWGIHTESPHVLTQEEIDALLPLVGSHHVHMDGSKVSLDEGCSIDLGGIAKGYASQRLAALFQTYDIQGGWVSLGGNVYTYGTKDDDTPWAVAIRDPLDGAASAAMVDLSDTFAVTSGGYQRYFTAEDGTVYQHILDSKTGAPAQSDLLSVTIIAKDGTMADAYSTALYVMGQEDAVRFWRAHRDDFDMILINDDNRLLYTPGLEEQITVDPAGTYQAECLH